jgi:hypothetical protein
MLTSANYLPGHSPLDQPLTFQRAPAATRINPAPVHPSPAQPPLHPVVKDTYISRTAATIVPPPAPW